MKTIKVMVDVYVDEDGTIKIPMENIKKAIREAESKEHSFSRRIALAKRLEKWVKKNCGKMLPMSVITFMDVYGLLDDEKVRQYLASEDCHDY